jgi:hypothetical protein
MENRGTGTVMSRAYSFDFRDWQSTVKAEHVSTTATLVTAAM